MKAFVLLFTFLFCLWAVSGIAQNNNPERGNGMMFTPNLGQITDAAKKLRPDILYKGSGNGTDVYIRQGGVSYVESNIGEVMNDINEDVDEDWKQGKLIKPKQEAMREKMMDTANTKVKICRLDMDFVDAWTESDIEPDDRVEGYTNYYLWNCPDGILHVYSYNELTVKNLYPGIDVTYHGDKGLGLKSTFTVYPGGDPSKIRMKYKGYKSLQVIKNLLMIETSLGVMTEQLPEIYQIIKHRKVDIKASYKVEYTNDNEAIVSYQLEGYDPDYTLFIDPWITYYGGSGEEYGYSIAADQNGNIVFTGFTASIDFPVSSGAFQTTNFSNQMAFIVKMNASGQRIFGTYLGGSVADEGESVACDGQNNIYIAGTTGSNDFPVGASPGNIVYQNVMGDQTQDAYLAKFDSIGQRLWATYYGGESQDGGTGIAFDKNSNSVVLYGYTNSNSTIATPGSFQTINNGNGDAFIAKFSSNGSRQWGTYIGGFNTEYSSNVCCDSSGNIFVCGTTYSDPSMGIGFPVITGHQMVFGGGPYDAFISKLNPSGTQLLWSSFYGGSNYDQGYGIACDKNGNIILVSCQLNYVG